MSGYLTDINLTERDISTVRRWGVACKFARKLKTFAAFSSPPVKLSLESSTFTRQTKRGRQNGAVDDGSTSGGASVVRSAHNRGRTLH